MIPAAAVVLVAAPHVQLGDRHGRASPPYVLWAKILDVELSVPRVLGAQVGVMPGLVHDPALGLRLAPPPGAVVLVVDVHLDARRLEVQAPGRPLPLPGHRTLASRGV